MSYHLVGLVMKARINTADGTPDPVAKFVLAAVAWNCRDEKGSAHPSLELLKSQTGHARRAIQYALERLEQYGLLTRKGRAGGRGLAPILQMDIARLESLIPIKPQRDLLLTHLRVEAGQNHAPDAPLSEMERVHQMHKKGAPDAPERVHEVREKGAPDAPHQHDQHAYQILAATACTHPAVAPLLAGAAVDRPLREKPGERPASLFGFSVCLKFSTAKQEELSIKNPGGFARSVCWLTGGYDAAIADWLIGEWEAQRRAASEDVEWGAQSEKEALYLAEKNGRLCLWPRAQSAVA